jgi:hypothetical protein
MGRLKIQGQKLPINELNVRASKMRVPFQIFIGAIHLLDPYRRLHEENEMCKTRPHIVNYKYKIHKDAQKYYLYRLLFI